LYLEKKIKDFLKKNALSYKELNNIPHISLYQFKSSPDFIPLIKKIILEIKCPSLGLRFKPLLEIVGNNIFWRCYLEKDDDALNSFHERLVNNLKRYKVGPLSQIDETKLLKSQEILVKEYGVYWGIPGQFDPHITLVYELFINEEEKGALNDYLKSLTVKEFFFNLDATVLAKIGLHGNIEKIL
jgi:hypothetical protein